MVCVVGIGFGVRVIIEIEYNAHTRCKIYVIRLFRRFI